MTQLSFNLGYIVCSDLRHCFRGKNAPPTVAAACRCSKRARDRRLGYSDQLTSFNRPSTMHTAVRCGVSSPMFYTSTNYRPVLPCNRWLSMGRISYRCRFLSNFEEFV